MGQPFVLPGTVQLGETFTTLKRYTRSRAVEHMPELTLIPWQGLLLAKAGHPCFTAASIMEGEMGNADGWGSF